MVWDPADAGVTRQKEIPFTWGRGGVCRVPPQLGDRPGNPGHRDAMRLTARTLYSSSR